MSDPEKKPATSTASSSPSRVRVDERNQASRDAARGQPSIQRLVAYLSLSCAPDSETCLRANGSGWVIVPSRGKPGGLPAVADGEADHAFGAIGGIIGWGLGRFDPEFVGSVDGFSPAVWSIDHGLDFLAQFVDP